MSDLVKRLRTPINEYVEYESVRKEAADEIERLRAATKRAEKLCADRRKRIAELEAAVKTQQQYLDNKDSVIKGMNEMVKRLEGDLEVMRLQRDATQSSRCPNCERLRAKVSALETMFNVYHHPDCNYWKWDWRYSWDKSDCSCKALREDEDAGN